MLIQLNENTLVELGRESLKVIRGGNTVECRTDLLTGYVVHAVEDERLHATLDDDNTLTVAAVYDGVVVDIYSPYELLATFPIWNEDLDDVE